MDYPVHLIEDNDSVNDEKVSIPVQIDREEIAHDIPNDVISRPIHKELYIGHLT